MRTLIIVASLLMMVNSCIKPSTECTPDSIGYQYSDHARIDTSSNNTQHLLFAVPVTGNKTVLMYTKNFAQCPQIADDEKYEMLIWQIEPTATSFNYTTPDFQNIMCYYRKSCYCDDTHSRVPQSGTITGTKLAGGTWQIQFDLVIAPGETVSGSGSFISQ